MYYLYILKSQKDRKKYIGCTNCLERRLKEHNSGKCIATKYRRPFELIYFEKFYTQETAFKREKFLKQEKEENILMKY